MGLCVDSDETEYGIAFEIRRWSVKFYLADGDVVEILKTDLVKMNALIMDQNWQKKLLPSGLKRINRR